MLTAMRRNAVFELQGTMTGRDGHTVAIGIELPREK